MLDADELLGLARRAPRRGVNLQRHGLVGQVDALQSRLKLSLLNQSIHFELDADHPRHQPINGLV